MKNEFLKNHLITYLGNKRKLLPFLKNNFERIMSELKKEKITFFDGFAGSGIVSRLMKPYCSTLYVNDMEKYAFIINKCYLANQNEVDNGYICKIIDHINYLQDNELKNGFISKNYAPANDNDIQIGERAFYTSRNAKFIDTAKEYIFNSVEPDYQPYFLAPLLVQASIHTNTSGHFKAFHKKNGIGHFGGKGENCLSRIKGNIKLEYPVFCDENCEVTIFQTDTNKLVKELPEVDIAYYDPPYNQHPYGSNYFMLNVIANDNDIEIQDGVSGIAKNWNKSAYNKRNEAEKSLDDLIKNTKAKYILISYNNEGIIPTETFRAILEKYGTVELAERVYDTYKGCRNLKNRDKKVREILWILKKSHNSTTNNSVKQFIEDWVNNSSAENKTKQ